MSAPKREIDPLGERDVQKEGKKEEEPHRPERAPPKPQAPSTLKLLKRSTFENESFECTYFVPNFQYLFVVLGLMIQNLYDYRRARILAAFTSDFEIYYFVSVLLFLRTLIVMRKSPGCPFWVGDVLDPLLDIIDPDLVTIPGPLIPFFTGISLCVSGLAEYKVTVSWPEWVNCPDATGLLPDRVAEIIPNIFGILRANSQQVANRVWNVNLEDPAAGNAPQNPGRMQTHYFRCAGTNINPVLPLFAQSEWRAMPGHPAAPAANTQPGDWLEFFGINTNGQWLSNFIPRFNRIAQIFIGCQTMGSIRFMASSTPLYELFPSAVVNRPANVIPDNRRFGLYDREPTGETGCDASDGLYTRLLAPVNQILTIANAGGDINSCVAANGPYWTARITFRFPRTNTNSDINEFIASFIDPRAMN